MGAPLHILVVDDWPDSVADLVGRLAAKSHRVQVISSGMEAINRVTQARSANDPINLLLIDYNLPDIDGPALVRELRRRGDTAAAAFISVQGSLMNKARNDVSALGMLTVLSKPVVSNELDYLLSAAENARRNQLGTARTDDAPFFGTTRLFKRPVEAAPTQAPPSQDALQQPMTRRFGIAQPGQPPLPAAGPALAPRQPPYVPPMPGPMPGQPPQPPGQFPGQLPPAPGTYRRQTSQIFGAEGQPLVARDPVTGQFKTPAVVAVREPNPKTTSGAFQQLPPDPVLTGSTNRLTRTTTIFQRRSLDPNQPAATPPGAPQQPLQPPMPSSGRYVRPPPIPGVPPPQGQLPPQTIPNQVTTTTVRLRRGVTATHTNLAADGIPASRMVGCAYCRGPFQVPIKAEAFTVICVHCGKPNQILP